MKRNITPKEALIQVLKIVGGQTNLASLCGLKQQTIHVWLKKYGRVPVERVLQIEKVVNGAVTRHELRPDIYPE